MTNQTTPPSLISSRHPRVSWEEAVAKAEVQAEAIADSYLDGPPGVEVEYQQLMDDSCAAMDVGDYAKAAALMYVIADRGDRFKFKEE